MGSSGSKPRKPVHHLPKVGSPENEAYELRERRREVFGRTPTILVAAFVLLVVAALVLLYFFFL